jgi:uncharacterized protein (TIGR02266 family)
MAKATKKLVPRDDRITVNHEFASLEAFITEYVSNISRSGAFIRTRHPLDVGTKVNLRFSVIMDEIETIEGVGEVVRVQVDPPGMGVVFVTLTAHSQDLIQKLITRRRATPPPRPRSGTLPGIGVEPPAPAEAAASSPKPRAATGGAKPPPVPADALRKPKKRT